MRVRLRYLRPRERRAVPAAASPAAGRGRAASRPGAGAYPADGDAASRQARAIVVAVLCILLAAKSADVVASGAPAAVPFVMALFVLPFLYVFPVTRRRFWARHRVWLLAAQAAATYLPFALFGSKWVTGLPGLLAGLVLLTVAGPASWLLFGALAGVEAGLRAGLVGLPYAPAPSATIWVLVAFTDDGLILFALVRLADLVGRVNAARSELAAVAVTRERLRVADDLRSAIGERLATAVGRAAVARRAMARSQARAREHIAEAGIVARQALTDARSVIAEYRGLAGPDVTATQDISAVLAPRLARTVLVAVLCLFATQNLNNVIAGPFSPMVTAAAAAQTIAIVVLQLRHSWPSPRGGRPRAWPATLALQAVLSYVLVPFIDWRGLVLSAFLAGSALLLLPGRWAWAAYAAVICSLPVLFSTTLLHGLAPVERVSTTVYFTGTAAGVGLTVYGLSTLARLALELETMRGELARTAVLRERLRVARDTHDLLGLGLSAIALKTDLIARLIGRDDSRACAEIEEMSRICATARTDMRLVAGETYDLPLDTELATAREALVSAGIDVRTEIAAEPVPAAVAAVLAPVLREAVTNILRHTSARHCTIQTSIEGGALRLHVSNDGATVPPAVGDRAGHGLANLTVRVEAAGGQLTSRCADGCFYLVAEIPLPMPDGAAATASQPGLPLPVAAPEGPLAGR